MQSKNPIKSLKIPIILIQIKPPLSINSYFIIKNKTNMALFETAAAYILNIITENEEVKKFPKEFVPC